MCIKLGYITFDGSSWFDLLFKVTEVEVQKGLSTFVWRLWKSLICGWWENGQSYHLANCRDNSLHQTIVSGEAINKSQIKYLRQLAFEVDIEPQPQPSEHLKAYNRLLLSCFGQHRGVRSGAVETCAPAASEVPGSNPGAVMRWRGWLPPTS